MAKGDVVTIRYRNGVGVEASATEATQNGRTVGYEIEKDGGSQWVVVREMTRGGTEVRHRRFLMSEVVSIEHDRA
jgi:hypothetical protein